MDEYVGMVKGIEREVAGAVAGITADDHIKSLIPQSLGIPGSPSFQPGGELEGDTCCPPLPQLADKIRDIV
jgi:hypothetical protein